MGVGILSKRKQIRPEGSIITSQQYEHHYTSYYKAHQHKLREIKARLLKAGTSYFDSIFSLFRALKGEEAWLRNSVILHGTYFNSLGNGKNKPSPQLYNMLIRDFGSSEEWVEEFSVMGISSRGWAVLGFDLLEGKLINCLCDEHAEGHWMIYPIIVLDVFEHAYQQDYGSNIKSYVKHFLDNIDWTFANVGLETAQEMYNVLRTKNNS